MWKDNGSKIIGEEERKRETDPNIRNYRGQNHKTFNHIVINFYSKENTKKKVNQINFL